MSSARGFQAAFRCAGMLRSSGRAAGFCAVDSFARSAVRMTGVCNPTGWAAQAAKMQQRAFPMPQPTYGFAAQGICNVADEGDASGVATGSSSGSSAVAGSSDDGECLPSGDSEGVIPRRRGNTRAPPWLSKRAQELHISSHAEHQSWQRPAGTSLQQLAGFTAASGLLVGHRRSVGSCTGVRGPHLSAASLSCGSTRAFATPAVALREEEKEDGSVVPVTAAAREAAAMAEQRHPSRPGHAAPVPHRHPAEAAAPTAAVTAGSDAVGGGAEGGEVESGSVRMSAEEYRKHHGIRVDGGECPEPYQTFDDAPFPPAIVDVIRLARYGAPSPIQAQAWPIAAGGRDLVAIASTGSGKTLGYLLPALMHIMERGGDPASGPSALVLAPTRELAVQIEQEAHRFYRLAVEDADRFPDPRKSHRADAMGRRPSRGRHAGSLRTVCLYGGVERRGQLAELRRQPHLVIATPGRLLDFAESGQVNLGGVSYLVLDEADRMLDMGFEQQIADIARQLKASRQTLFFSATWPEEVRDAARRFATRRPVQLFIGDVQARPVAARTITQRVQVIDRERKMAALETYLRERLLGAGGAEGKGDGSGYGGGGAAQRRAIVFCKTKAYCDLLAQKINSSMPFQAASLHGDKSQAARDFSLQAFRSGRVPVLVATDVAARGLDIPNITAVVNFDMPVCIDDYVHRIGRTGRAGALGDSLALVTSADRNVAPALVGVLEEAGQEVPAELRAVAQSSRPSRGSGRGGGGRGDWGRRDGGRGRGRDGGDRERSGRADREEYGEEWEERPRKRHHSDDWRSGGGSGGGGRRSHVGRRDY